MLFPVELPQTLDAVSQAARRGAGSETDLRSRRGCVAPVEAAEDISDICFRLPMARHIGIVLSGSCNVNFESQCGERFIGILEM